MNTIEIMDLLNNGWKLSPPESFYLGVGINVALCIVGTINGWILKGLIGRKVEKARNLARKVL